MVESDLINEHSLLTIIHDKKDWNILWTKTKIRAKNNLLTIIHDKKDWNPLLPDQITHIHKSY